MERMEKYDKPRQLCSLDACLVKCKMGPFRGSPEVALDNMQYAMRMCCAMWHSFAFNHLFFWGSRMLQWLKRVRQRSRRKLRMRQMVARCVGQAGIG